MNAWIMSKYGVMTQSKMKEVLISICIDAGEEGKDPHFGYGVPILPIDGIIKRLEGVDTVIDNNLYTVNEIIEKLKNYDKTEFHIHHTWKPDINDFTGSNHIALQNGMRSYHMGQRNFEDIAQHITQFPDGKFMVGRNFNWIPASSKGYRPNGQPWNNTAVFMVENIGNFDKEEIPKIVWDNLIKIAAYFQSIGGKFFFHRQMDASKSCPGWKFRYKEFMDGINKKLEIPPVVEPEPEPEKPHWAKIHKTNLAAKGIIIHEERFDDNITRGEVMALLDRATDK